MVNCRRLLSAALMALPLVGWSQPAILWEAFNDHRPSEAGTSPNASTWDMRATDEGGVLRNIATGADLTASFVVVVEGDAAPDNFGANSPVNAGSPADKLFKGKVDVGNDGIPGVRSSANTKLILVFNGLNPARRYNFRGTASRGGNYNDRWSLFGITGAEAFVDAHQDGSNNQNVFTKVTFAASQLQPHQVALNTGDNKAGSLVGWDNIEPGADGSFSIEAQQYTGKSPFGNPSAAAYGYAFSAIYLAEVESTGNLRITENPSNQLVPAGAPATLKVSATSQQTIEYQWQKAPAVGGEFANVPNATQSTYTTPVLVVADDGSRYRCQLRSGGVTTVSPEAVVRVDGSIPSVKSAVGSVNLNAVHVTFSEAMKLDQLANKENYELSGGLTIASAVALDPLTARLLTSAQGSGTTYTLKVKGVQDLAGNSIPSGSALSFAGFTVQKGFVGLEVWNGILGGAIADLRNDPRYPLSPEVDAALTTFNSELVIPNGPNNTYGGRLRSWITPEENGDYEFFLRADDTAQLFIGLDDKFDDFENPERVPDAVDTSAGDTFQEPGIDLSVTTPISMVKGKRYAIQAVWKEGNGNDYCQVAWRKVGSDTPADQLQPIDTKFLAYYGPSAVVTPPPVPPAITRIGLEGAQFVVEWTGLILQSSTDLVTWSEVVGAANPYKISTVGNRFFRAKNN